MQFSKDQRIVSSVIEKAWEDATFKANLLASDNPRAFIEEFAGEKLDLPEDVGIKVSDQSDPCYGYLNLPAQPDMENLELSDEQLETVAGGDITVTALIASMCAAGALSFTITKAYN